MTSQITEIHQYLRQDLISLDKLIQDSITSQEELVKSISYHLIKSGGKRIRPILTILSAKLFNYEGDKHLSLAAAVEFIHAATLLHDDVVDESSTRRGKQTSNYIWGNKPSILVGDYIFSQSFVHMVNSDSMEALRVLSQASAIIAEGEVIQLANIGNIDMSVEKYREIINAKTAELFAASCKVGSIIAGAKIQDIAALEKIGRNLGLIFQIKDDYLDYFADANKIGKNIGDDYSEGKITLPIILALNKASKQDKEILATSFNFESEQRASIEEVVSILNSYNVQDEVYAIVSNIYKDAEESLNNISTINHSTKDYLLSLLNYAYTRDY